MTEAEYKMRRELMDLLDRTVAEYKAARGKVGAEIERAYLHGVKDGVRKAAAIALDNDIYTQLIDTSAWSRLTDEGKPTGA